MIEFASDPSPLKLNDPLFSQSNEEMFDVIGLGFDCLDPNSFEKNFDELLQSEITRIRCIYVHNHT